MTAFKAAVLTLCEVAAFVAVVASAIVAVRWIISLARWLAFGADFDRREESSDE